MSTVPGSDAWRDAGLAPVDPDGPRSLEDESVDPAPEPEDYEPGFPRPDRDGDADEADVIEQDTEVPTDDEPSDA
ncbi:hypothetical protein [Cellulomonas fengjieae]|uniref:Uncharacterized protein n=1 Tax=Cellulomonas fengjieae TaxID=2819978 RepID=A0ABS3SL79_9CELL|nr:hypothetical protein [Cellulomonas fengjieae]MBO3086417.1 hypothetical protein [Cellulomonas fengjieae]MBO3100413.1 hypothetical protein [Cellulomonas fengjieae]QVI66715.1 hypothetical protein KG102_03710 [Cellulomonas fengjieae]